MITAPTPDKTKTYTPITHNYAITTILQVLSENNFTVLQEEYRCTANASVGHGSFVIEDTTDPELKLVYSFSNSYDKSLRFRSTIGAKILINDSYMLANSDQWKRKHTGTGDTETEDTIRDHVQNARKYFDELIAAKERMKKIEITKNQFGRMLGELLILDLLAIDQVSAIVKEFKNSSFKHAEGNDSLWTCYKHIMFGLKQAHPYKWMTSQIGIHMYFCTEFSLISFDDDEVEVVESSETHVVIDGEALPRIPGILDGVEELPILPGFTALTQEEPIVKPVVQQPEPHQVTLEEEIQRVEQETTSTALEPNVEIPEITSSSDAVLTALADAGLPMPAAIVDVTENGVEVTLPKPIVEEPIVKESITEETPTLSAEDIAKESAEAIENAIGITEEAPVIEEVIETVLPEIVPETVTPIVEETPVLEQPVITEEEPEPEIDAAAEEGNQYLAVADFEGYTVGDAIEIDGIVYLIKEQIVIEDEDYFIAVPIETEEVDSEEPITEEPIQTDPIPEVIPEVIPEIKPVIEEPVIQDNSPKPVDKTKLAIGKEIEEIYGVPQEFTYALANDFQYDVTLETNEVIVLSRNYIDNLANTL
jgi:hypothetical protein